MLGPNAYCYQAVQRDFRNTLVTFIRERMMVAYPSDHAMRLKKPFAKEWDELVSNARLHREPGGTKTRIKDEYDLLSVGHFFGIFDAYYEALFANSERAKPSKPKLMGLMKLVKDARDPLSHPVEEEIGVDEARIVMTDCMRILDMLGFAAEAASIACLVNEMLGTGPLKEDLRDSIICNLPTRDSVYYEFIGRRTLLEKVRLHYEKPRNRKFLLAGDGGKGKSALAYRYAENLAHAPGEFKLILWFSAKRRRFLAGSVHDIISPDFTDLDSAVNALLQQYGATAEDLQKPLEDRKDLLLEFLNSYPAFIVVDDIDSVLDDADAVNLFTSEIPATQSRVLLTSRRDIPGIRSEVVCGFSVPEAEIFIQSCLKILAIGHASLSSADIARIREATENSPLYIEDLLRLIKVLPAQEAIEQWKLRQGDEARKYALQRELESLSSDASKVLLVASAADDPVSFAELQQLVTPSQDRLISALLELQTLFLFPKANLVEGEQRYEINPNTRELVRLANGHSDAFARAQTKLQALRGTLPRATRKEISPLIRQAVLHVHSGRSQDAERILLNAIEKYPGEADLQGVLGFAYRKAGRIADARGRFETAFKLKCSNRETYLQWVKMEMHEREWNNAILAADKALKVIPESYEIICLRAYSKLRLGQDLLTRLQREKAGKLWNEAVVDLERALKKPEMLLPGERELNADAYKTIVICSNLLGDFDRLNRHFYDWEREHPDDPDVARQKESISRERGSLFKPNAGPVTSHKPAMHQHSLQRQVGRRL